MAPRERLRALLAGTDCLRVASVFDPMSARIAHELGFEAGLMGGSVASLAVLGDPDLTLITLTELAQQARRVCRAAPALCVLVDADHGYGNALNVARTVGELDAAGIAGLTLEDTLLPALPGASAALIPPDEAAAKMRAAVQARGAGGPLVLGRTSAATLVGTDEAIARLQLFERLGVDALFVPGLRSRAQLDAIAQAVRLPLVLAACDSSLDELDYLGARGVRLWMAGHQPFGAAVQAMYDCMRQVRSGVLPGALTGLPAPALMARLSREAQYAAQADDARG